MELAGAILDITSFAIDTGVTTGKIAVAAAPLKRQCHVEISNESKCYSLCNPSLHTRSGFSAEPLPPKIDPLGLGEALFVKAPVVARGAVGVFTYDLLNNSTRCYEGKIAVMYKVPFDLNINRIEYAIGVFASGTECNKQLFRQMSQNTGKNFIKGKAKNTSLTYSGEFLTIRATMSTNYTPAMKIQAHPGMEHVKTAFDIGSTALGGVNKAYGFGKETAKKEGTDRKCSVTISNETSCYILCNPRATHSPGAVGVFTYDLCDNSTGKFTGRMAVMYKVPDLKVKTIAYAVGVVDESTECNSKLFRRMSKATSDPLFTKGRLKGPVSLTEVTL
ncbi:hypothetical protein WMY93_002664 [Mugilogobius chulae]|uniref:Uncharacterized protein n=1 Tax=Mugilogobius chulae TaxID=88201 RepID=A0AAW0PUJ4_9GOBI